MQVLDSFVAASGKDSSPGYFLGSRSAYSLRAHHHAYAHQAAFQRQLSLAHKDWPVALPVKYMGLTRLNCAAGIALQRR